MFKFMNFEEASKLPAMGFDVQLHTHRHVFSRDNRAEAEKEVEDNMRVLSGLGIQSCKHFCYPSGEYAAEHPDWLRAMGMESAVTTDFGLVTQDSNLFFLKRICDSDAMGELDFEAAVSGFKDLVLRSRSTK
jgi:peptidoglycan/xylan/chitin deacetylase (PgdA/CDA1 family)